MTKRTFNILISCLIVLILIDSNLYLNHFGFRICDDDQTLFWNQSKDLSQGIIKSLFVYGQDYNIPLECYIAAPLLSLGIPVYKALPLASILLMLAAFALISRHAYKKNHLLGAFLALGMPLLLPTEWQALSAMPRGFFGGIFLVSLAIFIFDETKLWRFTTAIVLGLIALRVNPNSSLLLAAFGSIVLFRGTLTRKLTIRALSLAILFMGLWFVLEWQLSASTIHRGWTMSWSFMDLWLFLSAFNDHFKGTAPFYYDLGFLSIALIVLILIHALLQKKRSLIRSCSLFLIALFITFGINKVHDGDASIFYSYSRMYLALPLVFLVFFNQLDFSTKHSYKSISGLFILILISAAFKMTMASNRNSKMLQLQSPVVQFHSTQDIRMLCDDLKDLVRNEKAELVLFYSASNALNYGCSALEGINTFYPNYERRTWLTKGYSEFNVRNIIFLDWNGDLIQKFPHLNWMKIDHALPAYRLDDDEMLLKLGLDFTFVQ